MDDMAIASTVTRQRQFFKSGQTLPIEFRLRQLQKIKSLLQLFQADILKALKQDLNKSEIEAQMTELMLINHEINFMIKHLKRWAQPQKVPSGFPFLWPGRSRIYYRPYGLVVIIGAWNYPLLLTLSPLIGALSAGNCVIVKPSEVAGHTQNLILKMINDHFPSEYVTVLSGGPSIVNSLLKEKFDYIFFTGNPNTAKIILQASTKYLTPCTLELGGKSPCIIDQSANLDYAVRRITWAKTINAGQTCIAPDYLYIHASLKDVFVDKFRQTVYQFFGKTVHQSDNYGRIINDRHFLRIKNLMSQGRILCGGENNQATRFIAPTLIDDISWQDPIMQEEIFGPLLPIFTFQEIDEVISVIRNQPKPLALYLFTNQKTQQKKLLEQVSFGGGCINDCMMQVTNPHLPFGGVGLSGMGVYHGKYSFETFSHRQSIFKKTFLKDFALIYPPFLKRKRWWLKRLLGF